MPKIKRKKDDRPTSDQQKDPSITEAKRKAISKFFKSKKWQEAREKIKKELVEEMIEAGEIRE